MTAYQVAATASVLAVFIGVLLRLQASALRPVKPSGLGRGFRKRTLAMEFACDERNVDNILGQHDQWNRKIMRNQQYLDFCFIAAYFTAFTALAFIAGELLVIWGVVIGGAVGIAALCDVIENICIIALTRKPDSKPALLHLRRATVIKWVLIFAVLGGIAPRFVFASGHTAQIAGCLLAITSSVGLLALVAFKARVIEAAAGPLLSISIVWTATVLVWASTINASIMKWRRTLP